MTPRALGTSWAGPALAALLLALNAGVVLSAMGPLHKPKSVLETDHRAYLEMTWDLPWRAEVEPPYCWRLLAPGLAHGLLSLGLHVNAAWYLLTNVALLGFLVAFHGLLRRQGFDAGEAALGLALVALLPGAVRWYEYQYWMSDPLALLLVTLGILAVEAGWTRWLPAIGVVGVLARETWLLVIPYEALRRLQRDRGDAPVAPTGPWRCLGRSALLALPPLLVLAAVRQWLLPHPAEDHLLTMRSVLGFRWRHLLDNQLYLVSVGSLGVLLPLVLVLPGRLASALRSRLPEATVVAGCYASLALGNNTDRLLVYAAPVLVPAGLRAIRRVCGATGWSWPLLAAASLALQALHWQQTPFHGVMGLSLYQPTNLLVAGAMLAFWLVLQGRIVHQRRRRADAPTLPA